MAGIFDNAKDALGGVTGDARLPDIGGLDLGGLDLGAIADKAQAVGLDPEQVKGLIGQ